MIAIGSNSSNIYVESEELIVGNLQPFSVYGVSVAAENSIGVGPFSTPEPVQTLEDGILSLNHSSLMSCRVIHTQLQVHPVV